MKIISDRVSEKYRKFIIEIQYEKNSYFALWGTDMSNPDFDYFVINNTNNIVCSKKISNLKLIS
ncbi:MAG: hypothetical protein IPP06_03220 [Saprospiraceae bacterium]|nr:hypothetical protein [Candidatus Vicinibacter affinis]